MKLAGKVCLITGAGKRIGRALALRLARQGAHIAIHYHSSDDEAKQTAVTCRKAHEKVRAECFQADLRDSDQIDEMVEKVLRSFGRVDVLINNAGVFLKTPVDAEASERWQKIIDVNLRAPRRLCSLLSPGMIERGSGVIINITDALIHPPRQLYTAYNISKTALEEMTRSLAVELAPAVRVNAVAPGVVLLPEGADDKLMEKLKASIPLKRVGHPDNIASACRFLIESDYLTGVVLPVDGGASLTGKVELD
ncbi:MAG: SDR family NAD(P)-dependent oxidoreductase [Candidatus Sumerlaeota bacterium]